MKTILCILIICGLASCTKKTEVKGKVTTKLGSNAPNVSIRLIKWLRTCKNCEESWVITTTDNNGEYYFTYKDDKDHTYYVTCLTDTSNAKSIREILSAGETNTKDFVLTK